MATNNIPIDLTADEALVLFEFASRFTNSDVLALEHPSEQAALWSLTAVLEKVLIPPLHPDYGSQLSAARNRLCERYGLGTES